MGAYHNGVLLAQPYVDGVAQNAYIAGRRIWKQSPLFDRTAIATTWAELRAAAGSAAVGEALQIIIQNDITADAPSPNNIPIAAGRNVTITSTEGNAFVLTQTTLNQRHFGITGTLSLQSIVLSGDFPDTQTNHAGILINAGGRVYMQSGSSIRYARNTSAAQGAAVSVIGVGAYFILNGGEIHNNSAFTEGVNAGISGGVYIQGGATAIMDAGSIHNNEGRFGGAVTIVSAATFAVDETCFIMNGGIIEGNIARFGGAVNVERGTFVMNSGEICENTSTALVNPPGANIAANRGGGGVFLQNGGQFVMVDGNIHDNVSANHGGGVMMLSGTAFTMEGGSITGNTAANNGQGVFITAGAVFNNVGGTVDDVFPVQGMAPVSFALDSYNWEVASND